MVLTSCVALLQSKKKRTKIRPLVLASFVAARDMYLVVGVIGAPTVGDTTLLHKCVASRCRLQAPTSTVADILVATDLVASVWCPDALVLGCRAVSSRFGNLFRKAADATAAQVKHDGFDLGVIEIKKEDLRKVYGPSALVAIHPSMHVLSRCMRCA